MKYLASLALFVVASIGINMYIPVETLKDNSYIIAVLMATCYFAGAFGNT